MCGICGFLGPGDGEVLRRMADTLVLRGPDADGFHLEEGVGLGHRRLSIIDLSPAGRQPMAGETGAVVSIFNGEIYNFMELRAELESAGHVFRSRCDAEVIPHAYEAWGLDFPTRLRGMFAIALWDRERRRLVLVRDRLGIKPLYWHRRGDLLLFGSEIKALMAHPGFPRLVSRGSLYHYLSFGYVPSPLAIFEDTWKLPPGHELVVEPSGERLRRWWDPLEAVAEGPLEGREEEHLERLEQALMESVRYRLISDVPLGAFLSGGVDSSLVVAAMSKLASGPVRTFTIGYWEKDYDESAHARRVAAYLGTEHTELVARPSDALETIPRLSEVYDEPFGDASAIPTYLVSRLARGSVTVALSGDGGDELFAGYPRYRWMRLAMPFRRLPPSPRRALRPLIGLLPHPKAGKLASWLDAPDQLALYFGAVGIWKRGALREIMGREDGFEQLAFRKVWDATRGLPEMERLMLVDLSTYLPDDILTKVDRASMAHSLEARVPLLDHRFVELALRLPLSSKFRGLRGKRLLRKLLARHLPSRLFERPKMGFGVPLGRWFRTELRDLLLDYTSTERVKREGFFAPGLIRTMVREHLEGRRDHQYSLWVLLMFQMWLERHRPGIP